MFLKDILPCILFCLGHSNSCTYSVSGYRCTQQVTIESVMVVIGKKTRGTRPALATLPVYSLPTAGRINTKRFEITLVLKGNIGCTVIFPAKRNVGRLFTREHYFLDNFTSG